MIRERSEQLVRLHREHAPVEEPQRNGYRNSYFRSDEEVIERARAERNGKFDRLFLGDLSDYEHDHSAADDGFVHKLWSYTQDEEPVRRIHVASGLHRAEKNGNRSDYLRRSIERARKYVTRRTKGEQMTEFKIDPDTYAGMSTEEVERAMAEDERRAINEAPRTVAAFRDMDRRQKEREDEERRQAEEARRQREAEAAARMEEEKRRRKDSWIASRGSEGDFEEAWQEVSRRMLVERFEGHEREREERAFVP